MKKNLTLLLRFYKPKKYMITYWEKMFPLILKFVDVHVLIDGTDIKFKNIPSEFIFKSDNNVGRFSIVNNHLKKNVIMTDFFKILDEDDYISVENLSKINLDGFSKKTLILQEKISFLGDRMTNQKDIDDYFKKNDDSYKKYTWDGGFQSYKTIFPTKLNSNENIINVNRRINFGEDTLLGINSIRNGSKIRSINSNFTIYHREVGCTRLANINEEIIENYYTFKQIIEIYCKKSKKKKIKKIVNNRMNYALFFFEKNIRKYEHENNTRISTEASQKLNLLKSMYGKKIKNPF